MGMLVNPSRFVSGAPVSTAYYDAVMADHPWAYWRLNETTGTIAADSSGNSRQLTCHNGFAAISSASLLASTPDLAVLLPSTPGGGGGVSGFVRVTSPNMPATNVPFTAEFWIKPTIPPPEAGVGGIICLGQGSGAPEIDVLDIDGEIFRLRVMRKGVALIFNSTGSWAYGTTLHVALRRGAGDSISLIVNGVADASSGTNAYGDHSSEAFTISYAVFSGDQYHMPGKMDEIALYSSALTDARLLAHYNASL